MKILFGILFLCCRVLKSTAAMPPDVYADPIKDSPVKVTAEVLSVMITREGEYSISKEVRFRLIKSFGAIAPAEIFTGHYLSVGKKPMPGPDQYYSPQKGDVVFLTLNDGSFTSYTHLTSELKSALEEGSAVTYASSLIFSDSSKAVA